MAEETPEGVSVIAELEDGMCIAKCSLDSLREQDINARIMDDAKFNQLVANIEKRGTLEQLPYCVLTDRGVEIVSGHHRTRAARAAGLDHVNVLLDRTKLIRSSIVELVVPLEEFESFVKALQSTKKYGDVKNAGAAVWLMTRSALREFGEDDGRAYTPIMKLFGRAAILETTAKGVKALIDRKMKSGEISSPWEIFENMLGETNGASRR